jgi:hypothetical protein
MLLILRRGERRADKIRAKSEEVRAKSKEVRGGYERQEDNARVKERA